jgi:uncharacterized protein YndB with AHSA1/START domain
VSDSAGGISNDAVLKATGRGWDEWFQLLDADNAQTLAHPDIATIARDKHGASDWWAQSVTVAYEQARGMREKHEMSDGFAISASCTVAVPVERLYEAFTDGEQRDAWLGEAPVEITKSTAGRTVRMKWDEGEGSRVSVELTSEGDEKSSVTVQHNKLPDADDAAARKAYWVDGLKRLKSYLEG